jgi:hypothetical protein
MFVVFSKLPAAAMALYPFIIVKKAAYKSDLVLVNHEKIHLKQQLELLILPFYLLYTLNFLYNLIKYKNRRVAYLNIVFEKEAYANEYHLDYLGQRPYFAWLKWLHNRD